MFKKFIFMSFLLVFSSTLFAGEYVYGFREWVNTWVPGFNDLHHTFACPENNTVCYSFPVGSNNTTGSYFNGGYASRSVGACHAQCAMDYNDNGVCHQHTNRVLWETGNLIEDNGVRIAGYDLSSYIFGVTGNKRGPVNKRFQACYESCGGVMTLNTD